MKTKNTILSKFFSILALTLVLLLFILTTSPRDIALPLLIIPFGLLGIIFYKVTRLLLLVAGNQDSSLQKVVAISVASFGVVLLLLRSLNQLTWKDGLITGVFAALFWLYAWRADFIRK